MSIPTISSVEDYLSPETFERIRKFADGQETPCLVVDMATLEAQYDELEEHFPYARVHYAAKANPAPAVLKMLRDRGASFDIASIYELDQVLKLGVSPDRISYGNTIKKSQHIRRFYEAGVRLFATDSETDLRNIARAAPGSRIFVRILTDGNLTSDWPLSRKFGCEADMAMDLIILARDLGLQPYGISFHVGSQQREIGAWDAALNKVKVIFERMQAEDGIQLRMINIGGGLPANYVTRTNDLATYASEIYRFLQEDFPDELPEIIIEPGRSLVANAGVLVSEVVLISRKSRTALHRWIYTDVGKFSGLIETLEESIKYPIYTEKRGELEDAIIAGPTCDSADILYENEKYSLPLNLATGDRVYFMSTGAYTTTYSAVEFNGFPPLKDYYI